MEVYSKQYQRSMLKLIEDIEEDWDYIHDKLTARNSCDTATIQQLARIHAELEKLTAAL